MEDLESTKFNKFIDAPSWSKSLTETDIKFCEEEYGLLARDFVELAELVRKTDRIFNEQFSSGQVPSRNDYVGLTFNADFDLGDDYWDEVEIHRDVRYLTVDLTKNTFKPVLRVHYSVLFLKPEIERISGVIAVNSLERFSTETPVSFADNLVKSFYLDLCNCFQFVEEEKSKWHYEGNSIKDGRRSVKWIIKTIERWQGLRLLRNSTMQNIDKAENAKGTGANSSGKARGIQNEKALTGEALALAMLVEHPDWPDTKIAIAVGVSRTTLYDWVNFKKAKEALKQGKNNLPNGSKDGETGDMEAWDKKD